MIGCMLGTQTSCQQDQRMTIISFASLGSAIPEEDHICACYKERHGYLQVHLAQENIPPPDRLQTAVVSCHSAEPCSSYLPPVFCCYAQLSSTISASRSNMETTPFSRGPQSAHLASVSQSGLSFSQRSSPVSRSTSKPRDWPPACSSDRSARLLDSAIGDGVEARNDEGRGLFRC